MRPWVLASCFLACSLAGCGTVENLAVGRRGRTEPYGGVRLAKDHITDGHDVALAMFWPFYLADLGLSAVADTITLPVSLTAAAGHAIEDYYFPPDKPGDRVAWRRFWFGDLPAAGEGELPPEPVSPAPSPSPTPAPSPATPSAGR